MEKILTSKKNYELQGLIGKGLSSEVYKALRLGSESKFAQVVAIKIFKSDRFRQKFQNELKNLSKINHPHVISVKDWGNKHEGFFIVTDYIHGINLDQLLKSKLALDEDLKKMMANIIYSALVSLRDKCLAHGDLKPSNIMLSVTGELKLIDLSFDDYGCVYSTPKYTAPEVLSGERPSFHSDLYSFGQILKDLNLSNSEKLIKINSGDRKFNIFKLNKNFDFQQKLSNVVREAMLPLLSTHTELQKPLDSMDKTQEFQVQSKTNHYSKVSKPQLNLNSLRLVFLSLCFLCIGFTKKQKLPILSLVKLRSSSALEIYLQESWIPLPYDYLVFQAYSQSKTLDLKFRSFSGVSLKRIPILANEELKVNIDAL